MTAFVGPALQCVEETTPDCLFRKGAPQLSRPLLVKGALRTWPAWERWSFDRLAELRHANGKAAVSRFQDGLVEQGATQPLPILPVAPYLRDLSQAAELALPAEAGLLSDSRRKSLKPGDRFRLNWSYLRTFETDRRYLADWPILEEFPDLRGDLRVRTLWPGWRWTWEYVFIGPANTVTGLHLDIHNNWFCQFRGTKEVVLFLPDQTPRMHPSDKYNLGSVLSRINISRLHQQDAEAGDFEKTSGLYARVEAGDALYIPKETWHAVVALSPSISLGVFGLSLFEVATAGAWAEFKNLLHRLKLYRSGHCICHEARVRAGAQGHMKDS